MTAYMIAALVGGNVKPGLAQMAGDCPFQISGVPGRSVCEDTTIKVWKWTAPGTGPIIFDTRRSDMSLQLSVDTFDPVYTEVAAAPNEVQFTAQQGVEYTIFAIVSNTDADPGTIVLNWRASSGGDDFASSTAISGNSGQREGSNVDAGKEIGEPAHAGDDGGASVRWTWTAPATGVATFDTRVSDFDTLLAVYTGDNLNRLAEVAANDDASQGEYQSVVRFPAQKDQTYHIAVDGYGGRTGAIVLNWRHRPCGGGDKWLVEVPVGSGLRETVFDDPDPGAPAYVLAGPNAGVWYWMTDNAVTQSLYVSKDESKSVRTFYDADGLPHKVLDECSDSWMLIQRYDAKNVDFWFYDQDGTYQSGFALFEGKDGGHYYAEIDGVPVHAGKQISGILKPSGASWTGSYTLEVDISEIQDAQPVSDQLAALINGLSLDETGSRDMVPGWQSRFAIVLGPLGAWLSPEVAVAQPPATVQDAVFLVGSIMVAVGTGGLAAPAYGAAGAVMVSVSYLAPDVSQEQIRSRCPDSPEMAHDSCHWAANNLARPGERGPIGFVSDLASDVGGVLSGASDRAKQALRNIRQFFNPPKPPQAKDEPIRRIPDDTPLETVSGTMTDGTTIVDVTGTVTSNGDFDMADKCGAARIEGSLGPTNDSAIAGTFDLNGNSGTIVGSTGGKPILIKPLPDWRAEVGDTKTIDLSQHFGSPNNGRLTYGSTGNDDSEIATASASGSTLTWTADRVFHHKGRPLGDLRPEWPRACREAGLGHRWVSQPAAARGAQHVASGDTREGHHVDHGPQDARDVRPLQHRDGGGPARVCGAAFQAADGQAVGVGT